MMIEVDPQVIDFCNTYNIICGNHVDEKYQNFHIKCTIVGAGMEGAITYVRVPISELYALRDRVEIVIGNDDSYRDTIIKYYDYLVEYVGKKDDVWKVMNSKHPVFGYYIAKGLL